MKKRLFLVLFGALLGLSTSAEVTYLTTEAFKAKVMNYTTYAPETGWQGVNERPCVVDFYTTWCGPCKRLAPIMDSLSVVYKGQVDFYKADTEKERELAYFFQINSIPQVLYVPVKGDPSLMKGLYPVAEITKIIDGFLLKKETR